MDHLEAESLGATEKYVLGTLDDDVRDAFEEHYFDCLECADEVRAASALLAAAGTIEAAALPAILPTASTQQPVVRAPITSADAPIPIGSARGRRFARVNGLTAAVAAVAASLCFIAYQNAVVIPDLRAQAGQAESIQAVRSTFLTLTRSEAPTIHIGEGDRVVALTLSRSWDRSFAAYRCELLDASGRVVAAETVIAPAADDELELLLPVRGLRDGAYVLSVEGLETRALDDPPPSSSAPVARYSFHLDRR